MQKGSYINSSACLLVISKARTKLIDYSYLFNVYKETLFNIYKVILCNIYKDFSCDVNKVVHSDVTFYIPTFPSKLCPLLFNAGLNKCN